MLSNCILAITLLLLFTAACKPTVGTSTPTNASKIEIPFELINNVIILPVSVGNSRDFKVILDTGMHFEGLLLYNIEPQDSVTLDNPTEVLVPGAGGGAPSTALMADSLSFFVGELECKNQRIIVLQNNRMEGVASEGVTGYSLFGNYVVEVNYDRMVITLHEQTVEVDSSWTWLTLTFKDNAIPWIEAAVNISGHKDVPVSCYIDLASRDALEILVKEDMKFQLPTNLEQAYLGTGLSGDIHGQTGRISSLKIGPYYLKEVITSFAPAEIRSKQDNADGVIGNDALRRFNVVFDYRGGKLYLKPNSHFDEPF